jgi:membrane-anchored protein YejM (alkaline phosphatase superfamily)
MPATAAFAAQNLAFTQHYSSGNSTQPGLGGLLYGIPATYWESISNADGAGGPAIVRAADALGYRFGAFSSPDTLQRLRFDRYFFGAVPPGRMTLRENDGRKYESDAASAEQLSTFLGAGPAPAFALIFFDSTHHRYVFPPDYPARFSPHQLADIPSFDADTDPTPYYNQYLDAAGFVDTQVARVLDGIAAAGRLDDTIVVITGDHGESFNDAHRGDWGHGLDYGELQTHVPLVVHWPGRGAARVDHVTEHADVTASLLHDALGCVNPLSDYTTGLGLLDSSPRTGRVVAGYVGYGIVTRSEIVSNTAGFVHVTDRSLDPKLSVDDDDGFRRGVEQMSVFYR